MFVLLFSGFLCRGVQLRVFVLYDLFNLITKHFVVLKMSATKVGNNGVKLQHTCLICLLYSVPKREPNARRAGGEGRPYMASACA